jgi:peptidoglycan/xylan/chitin deacetylase (PgdA/CDA1 family)
LGGWDEYLSVDEILAMAAKGVEFGSHTHSHPRLTSLDDEKIRAELRESRESLGGILGTPPMSFCYPYGNFSRRVAEHVKESGYLSATSTVRDNRANADKMFWLPRIMVMPDTRPSRFGYMFSSLYHWVHWVKNRRRWPALR